jgi:hypothetical protein
MTEIKIKYYGMDGEGKNLTEAKRDAGEKISKALDRIGYVEIMTMGNLSAIIYGDKYGFSYKILWPDMNKNGRIYGCSHHGNIEETKRSLLTHLAQATWTTDMGTMHPDLTGQEQREFSRWASWQLKYADGKQRGMDDTEARNYANSL